jgi:hypothetical protein
MTGPRNVNGVQAAAAEHKRIKTREKYRRKLEDLRRDTEARAAQLAAAAEEQLQAAIERSCRKASEMSLRQELESRVCHVISMGTV